MKPPPFAYARPTTLDDALETLAEEEDALPLAGGQSLVPMLNMRLVRPAAIVDLSRVPGLTHVTAANGSVSVGARVTHHALARHSDLASITALPVAVGQIGYQAIRHRGTLGGSVAHADPAAELLSLLLSLDASVNLASASSSRELPIDDFLLGYYTTARRPDELVTAVTIPTPRSLSTGFSEFSRRPGDFALALAAVATWEGDGGRQFRAVVGGLDVRPRRLSALEAIWAEEGAEAARAADLPELLASATDPSSDIHGSAAYRIQIGAEMLRRALAELEAA